MAFIADRPILHAAALFAETAAKGASGGPSRATIGVLAIQGAFLEHITYLRACGADAQEVREPHHFDGIDGLIIPGGESTTMAIVAKRRGMVRWPTVPGSEAVLISRIRLAPMCQIWIPDAQFQGVFTKLSSIVFIAVGTA